MVEVKAFPGENRSARDDVKTLIEKIDYSSTFSKEFSSSTLHTEAPRFFINLVVSSL